MRAAPEAVRLLDLKPKGAVPTAEAGWTLIANLKRSHVGMDITLLGKLRKFQAGLIADIVDQAGLSEEDARRIVERNLVGPRKHPGRLGVDGLYASPEVVELLERDGVLRRR